MVAHHDPNTNVAPASSSGPAVPQPWPPEVRERVQSMQAREYRRLAAALGLGSDPRKAFAHLSRSGEAKVTPQEREHLGPGAAALVDRYLGLGLPTPYEHPIRHALTNTILDGMAADLARTGREMTPKPFLATIPSGEVSARLVEEPTTGAPIVLFEQGLFQFFFDFAKLIGWACPPLSWELLRDDAGLTRLAHRYTMPFQASEYFIGMLHSYAADGSPIVTSLPILDPAHNLFVPMVLLTQMERFVMAHEWTHLKLGHLAHTGGDPDEQRRQEFEADGNAMAIVTTLAQASYGGWAVAFWACDLALTAMNFLERSLWLLAFGDKKVVWVDKTHPDPLRRRENLRAGAWTSPHVPAMSITAARELCGMTDGLLQRLWEMASATLLLSHIQGTRPSPMWSNHIARTFTVAA